MTRLILCLLTTLPLLLVTACHKKEMPKPIAEKSIAEKSIVENVATDQWVGKWDGPEGTFLKITGSNGKYQIIIQDLDGPKTFDAISLGDKIQFTRDGVTENIRATNGEETGMKWLQDKHHCLTLRAGEGWCKD